MPTADGNGAMRRNFKLNEATFLPSLMPKGEIAADRLFEEHPDCDCRGVVVAIFDSGVDPATDGLKVTSDGKPKILDVIDCTSTVVKADANGRITGTSGIPWLRIHHGKTHLENGTLVKERKKKWEEKNQKAIAAAISQLDEFDKKHPKIDNDTNLKKTREDLQNRVDLLRMHAESYDDKGPVIDAVVWHDGEFWRAANDTQNLEDAPGCGKLTDFVPLTNYRIERQYGIFSKLDACTFVLNVYNDGNVLSIVTNSSPQGTLIKWSCPRSPVDIMQNRRFTFRFNGDRDRDRLGPSLIAALEIINAANDVIGSVDKDEMTKYFALKSDPDEEDAEATKKKMEMTRDQLTEALYQKGLALAEIESLKKKVVSEKVDAKADVDISEKQPDSFEENIKELKKWADIKAPRFGTILL